MKIKDLMSKNFSILPDKLSPSDAGAQLGEGEFGVVVDDEGKPYSLVTAQDIRILANLGAKTLCKSETQLPRTMVLEDESDPAELKTYELKLLTDSGSHGCVVLDAKKKVGGVVTYESVLCSSMAGSYDGLTVIDVAGALAGNTNTGPAERRCWSLGCGFVNRVHYLDYNHPPRCGNKSLPPHSIIFQTKGGA